MGGMLLLGCLAWAVEPPRVRATLGVASGYVDAGWVVTPDPVMSTTIQVNWEGFYFRHWEEWDLSDYQSPERSGRYDNSRKYRIRSDGKKRYLGMFGVILYT